ncbi:hypothetical protein HUN03_00570 [Mycoplasmopsis anatis]|uniref:hypothetical protein n=1 Tax=Mycoplasmopsis anatis TaxID=171279 RepID=UPI001C4E0402|nr:hypothetical protein [Mycoplasmopsis anatis]MBW0595273.1 hypothetical protein [Mycoplasmopsis anatis]MBW0601871.1 hypothetical protein [Mycoplasmopsis anatis]MBW0603339.1 hypothetical protein [Mycoplasmopsis anatis]
MLTEKQNDRVRRKKKAALWILLLGSTGLAVTVACLHTTKLTYSKEQETLKTTIKNIEDKLNEFKNDDNSSTELDEFKKSLEEAKKVANSNTDDSDYVNTKKDITDKFNKVISEQLANQKNKLNNNIKIANDLINNSLNPEIYKNIVDELKSLIDNYNPLINNEETTYTELVQANKTIEEVIKNAEEQKNKIDNSNSNSDKDYRLKIEEIENKINEIKNNIINNNKESNDEKLNEIIKDLVDFIDQIDGKINQIDPDKIDEKKKELENLVINTQNKLDSYNKEKEQSSNKYNEIISEKDEISKNLTEKDQDLKNELDQAFSKLPTPEEIKDKTLSEIEENINKAENILTDIKDRLGNNDSSNNNSGYQEKIQQLKDKIAEIKQNILNPNKNSNDPKVDEILTDLTNLVNSLDGKESTLTSQQINQKITELITLESSTKEKLNEYNNQKNNNLNQYNNVHKEKDALSVELTNKEFLDLKNELDQAFSKLPTPEEIKDKTLSEIEEAITRANAEIEKIKNKIIEIENKRNEINNAHDNILKNELNKYEGLDIKEQLKYKIDESIKNVDKTTNIDELNRKLDEINSALKKAEQDKKEFDAAKNNLNEIVFNASKENVFKYVLFNGLWDEIKTVLDEVNGKTYRNTFEVEESIYQVDNKYKDLVMRKNEILENAINTETNEIYSTLDDNLSSLSMASDIINELKAKVHNENESEKIVYYENLVNIKENAKEYAKYLNLFDDIERNSNVLNSNTSPIEFTSLNTPLAETFYSYYLEQKSSINLVQTPIEFNKNINTVVNDLKTKYEEYKKTRNINSINKIYDWRYKSLSLMWIDMYERQEEKDKVKKLFEEMHSNNENLTSDEIYQKWERITNELFNIYVSKSQKLNSDIKGNSSIDLNKYTKLNKEMQDLSKVENNPKINTYNLINSYYSCLTQYSASMESVKFINKITETENFIKDSLGENEKYSSIKQELQSTLTNVKNDFDLYNERSESAYKSRTTTLENVLERAKKEKLEIDNKA